MKLLWSSDTGLTSVEMLDKLDDADWNKLNIFRTINSLIDKDLIKVSGFEKYNTQYARRFTYSILCSDGATLDVSENIIQVWKKDGRRVIRK